jgi:hypothetical protein
MTDAPTPSTRPTVPLWKQRPFQIGAAVVAVVAVGVGVVAFAGGDDEPEEPSATTAESTSTTKEDTPPVAPLTGLPAESDDIFERPALIVKVDNIFGDGRPPQAGIELADVVFEEEVEGTTRLHAIWHSRAPERIGPVRSTRLLDAGIAWQFGEVPYVFSGGAPGPVAAIQEAPVQIFDETALAGIDGRVRDPNFNAPHDLFMFPEAVWGAATLRTAPDPLFRYLEEGERFEGQPVTRIDVPNQNLVSYFWDEASGTWKRDQLYNGEVQPHMTESGDQVAPTNVIVQRLPCPSPEACTRDSVVGNGEAWVFSAGRMVRGTWERPSLEERTVYRDADGEEIRVVPGSTWISLITAGEPTVTGPPASSTTAG